MVSNSVSVLASIVCYCLCSGTLLLLNKVAISALGGGPSVVSCIQVTFTASFLLFAKSNRILSIDDFEWAKVKPYLYYVAAFVVAIICNMKALSVANVDTVIVFRSCTPLAVAILDWIFLGRELPGLRSSCCLVLMLLGAYGYVSSDASFAMNGFMAYGWVSAYFLAICFEMTYGKSIVSSVKMQTVGGSVLYTNVFGAPPMWVVAWATGELAKASDLNWSGQTTFLLLISCLVGTGISYAGWWCRGLISATSYTVVGVANKMLTLLLNVCIWDKHASPTGMAYLVLCLVGGALYKQAPLRNNSAANYGVESSGKASPKSSGRASPNRKGQLEEGMDLLRATGEDDVEMATAQANANSRGHGK